MTMERNSWGGNGQMQGADHRKEEGCSSMLADRPDRRPYEMQGRLRVDGKALGEVQRAWVPRGIWSV